MEHYYSYTLFLRDDKGEDYNIVLVNCWDQHDRDKAMAALATLRSVCNGTVTAWLECDCLDPIKYDEVVNRHV